MHGDGLNTLVTDGTLNIDCSSATLEGNRALEDRVWFMCVSRTDPDVSIFTSVYSHICNNQQAFIQSEDCLNSGAAVEARRRCNIETTDYERRCREEPDCVENSLRGRNGCSKRIASVLRDMAALDFSVTMGEDCIYRAF
ncbi:uncharacterized protein [Haliotis asinina]|uniref:uncharacterized protein n=1 Tax=Haliotis asinina TaxID=109174 RepID=UPI003531C9D1